MGFTRDSSTARPTRSDRRSRTQAQTQSTSTGLPRGNRERIAALDALRLGPAGRTVPVGATGSRHEHEADRWASAAGSLAAPGRAAHHGPAELQALQPSPWRGELHARWGAGSPLDAALRSRWECSTGVGLDQVRLHRGPAVDEVSARIGARAWTLGTDVYLGREAAAPSEGLLAHELAHVLQQSGAPPQVGGLSPAPYQVQRQPAVAPPAPAPPAFSVNQATYLGLVNTALGTMTGRLVNSETLASTVVPLLTAMAGSVVWKDAQGNRTGGGAVQATVGTTTLGLTLVLDDNPDPTLPAGRFSHAASGGTTATIEVFIPKNPTVAELQSTLYHEAMHLASWLINRPTPVITTRGRGSTGVAGAVATLDQSRGLARQQISTVRLWLDTLASSVNPRRGGGAQIGAAQLDTMASWLVEEINVRVESEVFRLVEETQTILASRGPVIIVQPGPNWVINAGMVDRYVFDFSGVFLPTDRAGLTATDRQSLATLLQILEGMYQNRVRRRFSQTPYLMGRGIPRAPVQIPLPPLVPPPFRPLPTP